MTSSSASASAMGQGDLSVSRGDPASALRVFDDAARSTMGRKLQKAEEALLNDLELSASKSHQCFVCSALFLASIYLHRFVYSASLYLHLSTSPAQKTGLGAIAPAPN